MNKQDISVSDIEHLVKHTTVSTVCVCVCVCVYLSIIASQSAKRGDANIIFRGVLQEVKELM